VADRNEPVDMLHLLLDEGPSAVPEGRHQAAEKQFFALERAADRPAQ